MGESTLSEDIEELLATEVPSSADTYVIRPTEETIEALVSVLSGMEGTATVRMLAADSVLKAVVDDFVVAGRAADLVAEGRLELRTTAEPPENSLIVTEHEVVAVVPAGGMVGGLRTDDETFVESAREKYAAAWRAASEFDLRTPPLSEVRETLETDIGEHTAADFDAFLRTLESAETNGTSIDEVTVSLLVAAKNGELLYDISKWGEDIGLASKATFSRTKTRLEDSGLIETEKVPIDVGRPRLRLMLGDDDLADAGPDELTGEAKRALSN